MTARLIAGSALVVAAVVAGVVLLSGSSGGHDVYVTVDRATGILNGQVIRAGGSRVGSVADISPVDKGRAARLHLEIDDEAWPLPKGTTLLIRWAGTINQYNRHIQLDRGPDSAPPLVGDGGELPPETLKVPVEFGELLATFDRDARAGLSDLFDKSGPALDRAAQPLHRALDEAPPALTQADKVFRDLNYSETALKTLVRATAGVTTTVDASSPGIGELVTGAGTTLDAIAESARGFEQTLDDAPATLRNVRDTLTRANPTLARARTLTARLGPGVDELRRIAQPLNGLLGTLQDVGPDVRGALATAATGAPDITALLRRADRVMPQLQSISEQAVPQLECIRPYTPELAAFGSLWGSSLSSHDGQDRFIRANVQAFLPNPTNNSFSSSADAVRSVPGTRYAFPRPPGYMAGDPWFLPQCGITEDALDPAKDPEMRSYSPADQIPDLEDIVNPGEGGR